ncbi:MAG: hypothetical protein U0792_22255 [Gemmataceae bacterium]
MSIDSTGQLKVYINGDDVNAIYTALKGTEIGDEIAAYITAVKLRFDPTRC